MNLMVLEYMNNKILNTKENSNMVYLMVKEHYKQVIINI